MLDIVYDCEIFQNHSLFDFYNGDKHTWFDETQFDELREFVTDEMALIGFNSFGYDDIMLRTVMSDPDCTSKTLYEISKRIITSARMPQDLFKLQYSRIPWGRSVDMWQILNKKCSLKEFECREHLPCVLEAEVDFDKPLPDHMRMKILRYCQNDTEATWALKAKNQHLIDLRGKLISMYNLGDRPYVLGDAGVAQAILISLWSERTGGWSTSARSAAAKHPDNTERSWPMAKIVSKRVKYETPEFREFFKLFMSCSLVGDEKGTAWDYDLDGVDPFKAPIQLGGKAYQLGKGGIHSVDGPGIFRATEDVGIWDIDVTSFYPSLMIVEGLYPAHIGRGLIDDFTKVRDMRVAAKKAKDKHTADALKIVANSTFGKYNDPYSPIRSIVSALRVTINGQLQLLRLIELFEMRGVRILSANTDGVTLMWHRDSIKDIDEVSAQWEAEMGHSLERVEYSTYARRDVNNYVAIKTDGKIKYKGAFDPAPMTGKTDERVVKLAAAKYLANGIAPEETVAASQDLTDFIYYARVKNGGEAWYGDTKIGKTIRWYVGRSFKQARRKNPDGSFDKLPDGDDAVLAMDFRAIPTLPVDINRQYYVTRAWDLIRSVYPPKPKPPKAKKAKKGKA